MKFLAIALYTGTIYISLLSAQTTSAFSQETAVRTATITVDARANSWSGGAGQDSGLSLMSGDRLIVSADPSHMWSAGNDEPCSRRSNADGLTDCYGPFSSGSLSANYGSLVGRIGDGDPFLIGTAFDQTIPETGPLYLYYWDSNADDNSGSISASVRVVGNSQPQTVDGWLGKWSGTSRYRTTDRTWNWWFAVFRTCDGYGIQTHTSGPDRIEILAIDATTLEFLFHDELGTRIEIKRLENNTYKGTVSQPKNTTLPRGRVDGERIGDADTIWPAISSIEIVDPGTQKAIEEISIGEKFAIRVKYDKDICREISQIVTVSTPAGSTRVHVTGNTRVQVSEPITVKTPER
ncbi:MAG: hypothetical protein ABJN26_00610 [Stappiaceae bacterium]